MLFPIPQALQVGKQTNELLDAEVTERNCLDWTCLILSVKKKPHSTGKQRYRLAPDLHMLNSIIQSSSYPLPKIQTIISRSSAYKCFTCLDFPASLSSKGFTKQNLMIN